MPRRAVCRIGSRLCTRYTWHELSIDYSICNVALTSYISVSCRRTCSVMVNQLISETVIKWRAPFFSGSQHRWIFDAWAWAWACYQLPAASRRSLRNDCLVCHKEQQVEEICFCCQSPHCVRCWRIWSASRHPCRWRLINPLKARYL
jgi:hypothetical protein